MTRTNSIARLLGALLLLLMFSATALAQSAKIQIVHAMLDLEFEAVDVYANWDLLAEDVSQLSATQFLEVEAGVPMTLTFVEAGADLDELDRRVLQVEHPNGFAAGTSSYGVLTGVRYPELYPHNPDGKELTIKFDTAPVPQVDAGNGNFAITMYNALPDCPTIDWNFWNGADLTFNVWDDVSYGEWGAVTYPTATNYLGFATLAEVEDPQLTDRLFWEIGDFINVEEKAVLEVLIGWMVVKPLRGGPPLQSIVVFPDGSVPTRAISSAEEVYEVPTDVQLLGNYPNPFNPSTTISFELSAATDVQIDIFDALGRQVGAMNYGTMPAGRHSVQWDASQDFPSGLYLYALKAAGQRLTRTMLLAK